MAQSETDTELETTNSDQSVAIYQTRMRGDWPRLLLVLLLLITAGWSASARAASDFDAARLKAAAANPPGVSVTLRLPGGRIRFHRGEVIPLSAVFASRQPSAYRVDTDPGSRDLQWGDDAFHVDSTSGASDPLRGFYTHDVLSYNGPGPRLEPLGLKPVTISYTLNEWLRFDVPGRYRVFLTTGRISNVGKERQETIFFQGRTAASNSVEFEILPDDPAWDAKTLRDALPLLSAHGEDPKTQDVRLAAARTVRFLGTPEAAKSLVAEYGRLSEYDSWNSRAYYQIRLGLFGSPERALVIQEMKHRFADPDFPVFPFFLGDLAQTQFLAGDKERQPSFQQRGEALAALTEQDRTELAASLPAKRGRARSISLYTLLATDDYTHRETLSHRRLAQALVPVFTELPPEEQTYLLDDEYWPLLRGPAMLPPLRKLYAHPQTKEVYDAVSMRSRALDRLSELSPDEGRTLLLSEIKSTRPRVDLPTLCSLPDRTLPRLDAVLAGNLESSLYHGRGDWEITSRLVQRYATRAALPRIKAAYRGNGPNWACAIQSNLTAYFLRTDHVYGLQQMRKVLASRKNSGCYRSVLSDVAALAPGPDVERLAVAHLHDPDRQVEFDAIKTLGTSGSRAAEAPLWARFREWHQQWAGKAALLEPFDPQRDTDAWQLEYTLTQALATAPGWLLSPAKLRTLQNLCVTRNAQANVAEFRRQWQTPVRISYGGEHDQWSVVQYGQLSSRASLQSKLSQFPRGTHFLLSTTNFRSTIQQTQAFDQLQPFLTGRGMHLDIEPPFKRPQKPGN